MAVQNPFEPGVLARGEHFANREVEVSRIAQAYRTRGARLVVYGERRMGKTSALQRASELVRGEGMPVAIASFATASDPADAARRILLAVREQVGRGWRETLEGIVGRLQGAIEVRPSPAAGMPPTLRVTFGLREEEPRTDLIPDALTAVHEQLEAEGRAMAIALDEFQRLHEWGGEGAEWALKGAIETHHALSYVLAGSKRHLIEAMVTAKGRALWKQVDVLAFGPIAPDELAVWLHTAAGRTGIRLPYEVCDQIIQLAGPRTRDIVQLAREVWFGAERRGEAEANAAEAAMERWVEVQSALYAAIWRERSPAEQRILRALALEPDLQLTSADAARRYRLGAKSTVQGTALRLVEHEHLVRLSEGGYAFDDPFFRRWIERNALPDLGLPPPHRPTP